MLMNPQKLSEMTDTQFEELITLIRHSSLNASRLSSNVAMAFLSNMPSDSKAEGTTGYEAGNEDDKKFVDYYDDDKPVELIYPESLHDAPSLKKDRFSMITSVKIRMSRLMSLFRDRKMSQAGDLKEVNMELDRKSKKKFNISYADLMVPSSFIYSPKMLDIPLHDFRKKAISTAESLEAKGFTTDEPKDHTDTKLYPFRFETNSLFREKHPWLHPTLSFTKLCRIKFVFMSLPNIVNHLDPSTSAIAWALFERLILIGIVTKFNRKLFSSICFILAYKFNQDYEPEVINEIMSQFTKEKNLDAKSIFYNEMKIFTLLDFSLKLKYSYIQVHIHHYLDHNNKTFFGLYDTNESVFTMLEAD